jgi:hypothetical protein
MSKINLLALICLAARAFVAQAQTAPPANPGIATPPPPPALQVFAPGSALLLIGGHALMVGSPSAPPGAAVQLPLTSVALLLGGNPVSVPGSLAVAGQAGTINDVTPPASGQPPVVVATNTSPADYRMDTITWLLTLSEPVANNPLLHRMGDEVATDFQKLLATRPPFTAGELPRVVDMLHESFALPAAILGAAYTKPTATVALLSSLAAGTSDPAIQSRVASEIAFVTASAAAPKLPYLGNPSGPVAPSPMSNSPGPN